MGYLFHHLGRMVKGQVNSIVYLEWQLTQWGKLLLPIDTTAEYRFLTGKQVLEIIFLFMIFVWQVPFKISKYTTQNFAF